MLFCGIATAQTVQTREAWIEERNAAAEGTACCQTDACNDLHMLIDEKTSHFTEQQMLLMKNFLKNTFGRGKAKTLLQEKGFKKLFLYDTDGNLILELEIPELEAN